MDSRIYDSLIGELKSRVEMLSVAVVRGNCATFEDYQYLCGQLRGLETAIGIIADLRQRMETIDD